MKTILLSGRVQSGGDNKAKPLAKVSVTVYEATAQDPVSVGTATTGEDGRFDLQINSETSDGIFYAVATVSPAVELVTIIGSAVEYGSNETVYLTINELTTVAAAFSMAQFIQNGVIGGDAFGLQIASLMNDNLVDKIHGIPSEVLLEPPNADETNTLRSTRSLANLISACINDGPAAVKSLFKFTTPPHGGAAPANTFEAMFNIARYPAHNVSCVYLESQKADTYSPALETRPGAWTLAVKVNNTGSKDYLFGGPANIAFDKRGYAWVTNNVVQGTPDSGQFGVVLKPNGKPADGSPIAPSEGGETPPTSPLFGGGLLGGGFGVAVDKNENVWLSNFGWGTGESIPSAGSVSLFNPEGKSISPSSGYVEGTLQVQDVVVDQDNNLWLASNGNASVVVYPNTKLDEERSGPDPNHAVSAAIDDGFGPFGIAIAADGSAWVTSSAGLWAYTPSNLSRFRYENGQLTCVYCRKFARGMKGLAIDSLGNLWVPSGGDDVVFLLNSEGEHISRFKGGGINGPWAVAIDGNDNVWVANFGQMLPCADYTDAAVSVLAGANAETRPEGYEIGEAISPPTGYTLPTAGAPVRLSDGELLYGKDTEPSYSPLMRMTSVIIDQAGNVWAINNWKPNFNTDASPDTGNPGGDGIVIFVGLAKPPKKA